MNKKICPICSKTFVRANAKYCFECMPTGLSRAEQIKIKRQLDRKLNPIILICPNCKKQFELPYGEVNRKYCFECMPKGLTKNEQNQKMRLMGKQNALYLLGNKCYICGFNKYSSALEFHHFNDDLEKKFNLSNRFTSYQLSEEILKELEKCIILCSNCHRAYHAKELEIDEEELKEKIKEEKNGEYRFIIIDPTSGESRS